MAASIALPFPQLKLSIIPHLTSTVLRKGIIIKFRENLPGKVTQNRSPLWVIEIGFDLLFDQPVKSDYRITRVGFMYKNFRINTDKVKARLKYLKHLIRGFTIQTLF